MLTNKIFKNSYFYLTLITLLGLGLRLVNFGRQPYWADEVLSLDISTYFQSLREMVNYVAAVEVHPPLYYVILQYWTNWLGESASMVRLISLIFGLGSIILLFYLGKNIFKNEKVGLVAALLFAIFPIQIQYSQEARPYIIFCFFGMMAALMLWRYYRSQKKRYLIWYIVANVIGLYLHYSYLFILAPLAGWGLIEIWRANSNRSREFIIWLVTHAAIFLSFAFWLVPFLYKIELGNFPIYGWVRPINFYREPTILIQTLSSIVWLTKRDYLQILQIFIAILAQVLVLWGFIWVIRNKKSQTQDTFALFFMLWLLLLPLILYIFSPQSESYSTVVERHIIFVTAPLALLVGFVVNKINMKAATALLVIFLASLVPYTSEILANDALSDPDYNLEAIGQFINDNYKEGDLVVVPIASLRTDVSHFLNSDIPVVSILPLNYFGFDIWDSRHTLGFVENEYQSRVLPANQTDINSKLNILEKIHQPKRIWLAGFRTSDNNAHYAYSWFTVKHWRYAYKHIGPFAVDMYVKP